jgi:hypothetical protein
MKLTELAPEWIGAGGAGISNADGSPAPERKGVGVLLTCPCGNCDDMHDLYVPFTNPIDGGPPVNDGHATWQRTGDTFETLTLTPSILRSKEKGGCGWHGFITNGEIASC